MKALNDNHDKFQPPEAFLPREWENALKNMLRVKTVLEERIQSLPGSRC